MTPDLSAIIEETIRLQQQTNHLQLFSMILIFVSNILIVLSVLNIRKATRVNREWSEANRRWSEALGAASGIDARQRPDPEEGLDPKGESPVPERQTPKA